MGMISSYQELLRISQEWHKAEDEALDLGYSLPWKIPLSQNTDRMVKRRTYD